jgi:uncharacterized membrane-anchored protein
MTTGQAESATHSPQRAVGKLPKVTAQFWIVTVLAGGLGEVAWDYFALAYDPVVVVNTVFVALVATLVFQLAVRRHVPWIYWTAVVAVSVAGTMIADLLHILLGVANLESATILLGAFAVIIAFWYATGRNVSVRGVHIRRQEFFFWLTALATFAFGTAVGDLVAEAGNLGMPGAGVVFAVLLVAVAVAGRKFGLNAVLVFWAAYVLARPLGASFTVWLGMPPDFGGLGLGLGPVGLALAVVIIALVGYRAVMNKKAAGRSHPESACRRAGPERAE